METAMRVGVPREIKNREYRVGLTPQAVRALTAHGHAVLVGHDAGAGIGAPDDEFRAAGATIADSICAGRVTDREVAQALGHAWTDPLTAIA